MNYVPLVDAAGTVIALVNPAAASSPAETVTYDPSGTPNVSGSANGWPFLYHGMEHESVDPNQFYYSGNGAYYSAQIMRSMSMTGAQGTSGPPGGAGPGPASLPAVSYSSPDPFNPVNNIELYQQSSALGDIAGTGAADIVQALGLDYGTGPVGPIVQYSFFLANWFGELFGGGSPDYPPNYWVKLFRATRPHGGPHPLYTEMIGVSPYLIVDQAGINLVSARGGPSINPPLVKDPPDRFGGLRFGLRAFATVVRALHPLEVLSLNAMVFGVGAALEFGGLAVAYLGCIDPTPLEPVTCAASLFALGVTLYGADQIFQLGVKMFKEATLPAFEDWGLR